MKHSLMNANFLTSFIRCCHNQIIGISFKANKIFIAICSEEQWTNTVVELWKRDSNHWLSSYIFCIIPSAGKFRWKLRSLKTRIRSEINTLYTASYIYIQALHTRCYIEMKIHHLEVKIILLTFRFV